MKDWPIVAALVFWLAVFAYVWYRMWRKRPCWACDGTGQADKGQGGFPISCGACGGTGRYHAPVVPPVPVESIRLPEPCRKCGGDGVVLPPGMSLGTQPVYCPECNADGRYTPSAVQVARARSDDRRDSDRHHPRSV